MTSAPAGGTPVPTETMRSLSTMTTALFRRLPAGSISLPARMALVAASTGAAVRRISAAALRMCLFILRPRLFDLFGDFARERLRRHNASEGPEAEDPALQRPVEA